ncbi:ABC transporter [Halobiforma lacisalsi AJ5]|uniref:ABC transporter n=1 Tax=Natronobacterium lacisalsi AJ5 TaxID=358396 RepID=M0LA00_NATLA|nr:ABC transporter [Halobiforma lacisalsi AJ5]
MGHDQVVGRAAVLAFGLAIGLVVGLGVGAALLGEVDVPALSTFVVATLAFAAIYASIVVGISGTTGSTSRATTYALGFFVIFELLWDAIPMAILYVIEGFSIPETIPDWVFPLMQVSPSSAYFTTVVALLPDLADAANADPGGAGVGVEADPAAAEPLYASPEIGIVVLALWLVVPFLVGYYRFGNADL